MTVWHSITENPPKVEEALYLVAIVTESTRKVVATAICEYDRGKYFWEVQHNEFEIHDGKITAWTEMPEYPEGFND